MDLSTLGTETRNDRTTDLDRMPPTELLIAMNDEDRSSHRAVRRALPGHRGTPSSVVVASLRAGGRLIYLGAGTSGRIGLLDAVECPPTFGTAPGPRHRPLAGGAGRLRRRRRGRGGRPGRRVADLDALGLTAATTSWSASRRAAAPRTCSAGCAHARAHRCADRLRRLQRRAPRSSRHADVAIEVATGPEVLTGSTRLKAGTAQKLVRNMLSTATMVRLGKVYGNLMVDVRATNAKLVDRAQRIVAEATGADLETRRGRSRRRAGTPRRRSCCCWRTAPPSRPRRGCATPTTTSGQPSRPDPNHPHRQRFGWCVAGSFEVTVSVGTLPPADHPIDGDSS